MPFRHTINPYRGCSHACVYCFARPTHDYLGLGIGTDFERKIVVKVNAVERLRAELRAPTWDGDHIAMGTNTDPYQHAEGKYHLTRGIVETLSGGPQPVQHPDQVDADPARRRVAGRRRASAPRSAVSFSIGTLDRSVWKLTEPGTPPPDRRVEALRRLTAMGIPCGVLVAPVLPGLSDSEAQLREVVEACAEAGAVSISRRGAAPAGHRAGPLLRLARGGAARPGPPPPGALPARRLPGGRGARAGRGDRAGGGPALRRDGAEPLPRDDAGRPARRRRRRRQPMAERRAASSCASSEGPAP